MAGKVGAGAISEWPQQDKRRMLHVVYRVGHLDDTIEYYKKHFGMQLLRMRDVPEEKYTNAFLGFGPEDTHCAFELTYNYGRESYDIGEGFGHFGLAVPDVNATVASIKAAGGIVSREPGPVKGSQTGSIIAFVDDPTGYKFELIQRESPEPFAQVMLRVSDLDKSIEYYERALGCQLLRKKDNPEYKYTLAFLAYGPENSNCVFELTYNWERDTPYKMGDAYAQVAISTDDVYKTAEAIEAAGYKVTKPPGPLPGLGTKITATTDPDGYKIVFVDNEDFLAELKQQSD